MIKRRTAFTSNLFLSIFPTEKTGPLASVRSLIRVRFFQPVEHPDADILLGFDPCQ